MTIDINALKSAGWQGTSVPSGATSYTKNSDGSFTFQIDGKDVKYNASGSVFETSPTPTETTPVSSGSLPVFNFNAASIFGGSFGNQNFDIGTMSYFPSMPEFSSSAAPNSLFSRFSSANLSSMFEQMFANMKFNFGSSTQVDGVTGASHISGSNNNISGVLSSDKQKWGVTERTFPDGSKMLGCRWTRFDKCQPEWLGKQKYMQQAAKELGLTIVYSDMERTVAESNAINGLQPVEPAELSVRTIVLQKYFPRSIALLTNMMNPVAVAENTQNNEQEEQG